jgi:hypothetical protein
MKRIALLGFIVFVVPVLVVSCNRCGDSLDFIWTFNLNTILFKPIKSERYLERDTITEDSIRLNLYLDRIQVTNFMKNSSTYSAMACENYFPKQKNYITSIGVGFVYDENIKSIDTALMQSLRVCDYQWKNCSINWHSYVGEFIKNIEGDYIQAKEVFIKIPSSHNRKNIQVITWAIKENGDTLKALSQKVFCK